MAALIRNGKMCRSCNAKRCANEGTEQEPIQIECVNCAGMGCDECDDGYFEIKQCPNAFCSSIVPTLNMIELFEQGMPPIAGGVLDQSASFLAAAKAYAHEDNLAKAEPSE